VKAEARLPVLSRPQLCAAAGAGSLPAQAREVHLPPQDGVPNSSLIQKKMCTPVR